MTYRRQVRVEGAGWLGGACTQNVASPPVSTSSVPSCLCAPPPTPAPDLLGAAGERFEARTAQPLTAEALAALARQDAASHDQYLRLMCFDDRLAELASQRGLLVRFHVHAIRAYQAQVQCVWWVGWATGGGSVWWVGRERASACL